MRKALRKHMLTKGLLDLEERWARADTRPSWVPSQSALKIRRVSRFDVWVLLVFVLLAMEWTKHLKN